jgi:hypothetical protein
MPGLTLPPARTHAATSASAGHVACLLPSASFSSARLPCPLPTTPSCPHPQLDVRGGGGPHPGGPARRTRPRHPGPAAHPAALRGSAQVRTAASCPCRARAGAWTTQPKAAAQPMPMCYGAAEGGKARQGGTWGSERAVALVGRGQGVTRCGVASMQGRRRGAAARSRRLTARARARGARAQPRLPWLLVPPPLRAPRQPQPEPQPEPQPGAVAGTRQVGCEAVLAALGRRRAHMLRQDLVI